MRIFPSRKSQVELSLQQIIGMVIAVIIVLATIGLFISLMNIFTGPPDTGSVQTLEIVYKTTMAFDDSRNQNTSCKVVGEYLQQDWSVVGFNADNITAADNNFRCTLGGDCIEESCGHDDNLVKPGSCGNGPCLCLCDGGMGDITSGDCTSRNAVCRRIPRNAGVDRFYSPISGDEDGQYGFQIVTGSPECSIRYTIPAEFTGGSGRGTGLCDMVVSGESCWWGIDMLVQYSLVVMKVDRSAGDDKYQLIVDQAPTSELDRVYPGVNLSCAVMVHDLEAFSAAPPSSAEQAAETKKGPSLPADIDRHRIEAD